jgi:hypothetical protein
MEKHMKITGEKVAELQDSSTTAQLYLNSHGTYTAVVFETDSVTPQKVVDSKKGMSLSEAIKWLMLYYVEEWESVFARHALRDKLDYNVAVSM